MNLKTTFMNASIVALTLVSACAPSANRKNVSQGLASTPIGKRVTNGKPAAPSTAKVPTQTATPPTLPKTSTPAAPVAASTTLGLPSGILQGNSTYCDDDEYNFSGDNTLTLVQIQGSTVLRQSNYGDGCYFNESFNVVQDDGKGNLTLQDAGTVYVCFDMSSGSEGNMLPDTYQQTPPDTKPSQLHVSAWKGSDGLSYVMYSPFEEDRGCTDAGYEDGVFATDSFVSAAGQSLKDLSSTNP